MTWKEYEAVAEFTVSFSVEWHAIMSASFEDSSVDAMADEEENPYGEENFTMYGVEATLTVKARNMLEAIDKAESMAEELGRKWQANYRDYIEVELEGSSIEPDIRYVEVEFDNVTIDGKDRDDIEEMTSEEDEDE